MKIKKISLKRRGLSWLTVAVISLLLSFSVAHAATLKSTAFTIETDTSSPIVRIKSIQPSRISLSTDIIDYGPITPTNPIKRQLTITLGTTGNENCSARDTPDTCSTRGTSLYVFQDHPLTARIDEKEEKIPDTTCDDGSCTHATKALWENPFTFGLGFSFDNRFYQQFPDALQTEPMTAILPGTMIIKLNVHQSQAVGGYTNTITFLAIPKL